MKNDALNKFKEEMNRRGLFRKIQVCVNLIPPPPDAKSAEAVMELHKLAAREAIQMYAKRHEDFCDAMAEAALDHLFEDILTDDLFTPDAGFTPTMEEQANMKWAEATAEVITGLFGGLSDFLKTI